MTSDNPFVKALTAELVPLKPAPPGYKYATAAELGMFAKPEDMHLASRKVYLKPTNGAPGIAGWQLTSMATHQRIDLEGEAVLILGMQGTPQGTPEHREALASWKAGKLALPSLADFLGMKSPLPAGHAPKGEAHRRESSDQLEQRFARQREEKRTGVRLEKPGVIMKRLEV